jgi:hypothetical protein
MICIPLNFPQERSIGQKLWGDKPIISACVDACLGGFVLPALQLGYQVPGIRFQVPGMTSMSADFSFGYATREPASSSIVTVRGHTQYLRTPNGPGECMRLPHLPDPDPGSFGPVCGEYSARSDRRLPSAEQEYH